jgi:hypothetical protein
VKETDVLGRTGVLSRQELGGALNAAGDGVWQREPRHALPGSGRATHKLPSYIDGRKLLAAEAAERDIGECIPIRFNVESRRGKGLLMTIAFFILIAIRLVCFLTVLSTIFQNNAGFGFICLFLTLCTGFGPLLVFVVGWVKSEAWEIWWLMMTWSVIWVATVLLIYQAQTRFL